MSKILNKVLMAKPKYCNTLDTDNLPMNLKLQFKSLTDVDIDESLVKATEEGNAL